MIITKIIFNNFKVYEGEQSLECNINDLSKPMILIGGKNGAGKTSIIEGIKLCLYGRDATNLWNKHASYNKYLFKIHNNKSKYKNNKEFSIQIEFSINETGNQTIILLRREWVLKNKIYNESLDIYRDGDRVEFIDKNYWQDYINKLVPIGLADFMFFNSEEFNSIPNHLENGFVDSLLKYFGIDIYKQLHIDLGRHLTFLGSKYNKKLSNKIEEYQSDLTKQKQLLEEQKHIIDKVEIKLLNQKNDKVKLENELKKKATLFANEREKLIKEKEHISIRLKKGNDKFEIIASEVLPFSLAPNLVNKLIMQLNLEREIKNNITISNEYIKIKSKFHKKLKGRTEILDEIIDIIDKSNNLNTNTTFIRHDFTSIETENIIKILTTSLDDSDKLVRSNRTTYNHLFLDQKKNSTKIAAINPEGPTKDIYDRMSMVDKTIGMLSERLDQNIDKFDSIQKKIDYLQIKTNAGLTKLAVQADRDNKVKLINNTRITIEKYYNYLIYNRFSEFKDQFKKMLAKLSVKGDLVDDIDLDIHSNKILFYDNRRVLLPLNYFSAGESEIIGLSIILAVFATHSSKFPLITDSPLNRLDKDHRKKVINELIKKAERQIIFLSTDEEISSSDIYGLEEFISDKKHIQFNKKKKSSSFQNQYFK